MSGRALVLLSLASVAAALLVTVVAGWAYGLGIYAASVAAFCLLLQRLVWRQRGRPANLRPRAASEAGDRSVIRPQP